MAGKVRLNPCDLSLRIARKALTQKRPPVLFASGVIARLARRNSVAYHQLAEARHGNQVVRNNAAVFLRPSLSAKDAMGTEVLLDLLPLSLPHSLTWRDNLPKAASHVVVHAGEVAGAWHTANA